MIFMIKQFIKVWLFNGKKNKERKVWWITIIFAMVK